MQVKILGTGAAEGIPAVFCQCPICRHAHDAGGQNIRTRSGTLVDNDIMIDFSPDTYMHVINYKLNLADVQHLLITHSHSDHFNPGDLEMRRPPYAHYSERPPMTVYGNQTVIDKIIDELDEWMRDETYLRLQPLALFQTVQLDSQTAFTALPALHKRDENCFVYLVERGGKAMLYGHDTGIFTEPFWQSLRGKHLDFIMLDCTCMGGNDGSHHMGLIDNVEIKKRMLDENIADQTTQFVVTHFSHNGGKNHEQLTAAANEAGFDCAYDGVVYQV